MLQRKNDGNLTAFPNVTPADNVIFFCFTLFPATPRLSTRTLPNF